MNKLDRINRMRQSSFNPTKPVVHQKTSVQDELSDPNPAIGSASSFETQEPSLLHELKQLEKRPVKSALNLLVDTELKNRLMAASNSIGCSQTVIVSLALKKALEELGY